jgi:hypothetical protein
MKVTLYKSSDGMLHETHIAYLEREARLKMLPELRAVKWCPESVADYCMIDDETGEHDAILSMNDLPDFIVLNADLIRNILNGAVISRRGRKPKVKETIQ